MAGVIFIHKHLFYVKSFITFINATKDYEICTLILGHFVFKVEFPFKLTLTPLTAVVGCLYEQERHPNF